MKGGRGGGGQLCKLKRDPAVGEPGKAKKQTDISNRGREALLPRMLLHT